MLQILKELIRILIICSKCFRIWPGGGLWPINELIRAMRDLQSSVLHSGLHPEMQFAYCRVTYCTGLRHAIRVLHACDAMHVLQSSVLYSGLYPEMQFMNCRVVYCTVAFTQRCNSCIAGYCVAPACPESHAIRELHPRNAIRELQSSVLRWPATRI